MHQQHRARPRRYRPGLVDVCRDSRDLAARIAAAMPGLVPACRSTSSTWMSCTTSSWFARWLGWPTFARLFDLYVVDGLVDLIGQVPRFVGLLFRPIQNGLVQFYALAMALGLVVFLLIALVWRYDRVADMTLDRRPRMRTRCCLRRDGPARSMAAGCSRLPRVLGRPGYACSLPLAKSGHCRSCRLRGWPGSLTAVRHPSALAACAEPAGCPRAEPSERRADLSTGVRARIARATTRPIRRATRRPGTSWPWARARSSSTSASTASTSGWSC